MAHVERSYVCGERDLYSIPKSSTYLFWDFEQITLASLNLNFLSWKIEVNVFILLND